MLIVFDCCFAGAFRWSSTDSARNQLLRAAQQERRFIFDLIPPEGEYAGLDEIVKARRGNAPLSAEAP